MIKVNMVCYGLECTFYVHLFMYSFIIYVYIHLCIIYLMIA